MAKDSPVASGCFRFVCKAGHPPWISGSNMLNKIFCAPVRFSHVFDSAKIGVPDRFRRGGSIQVAPPDPIGRFSTEAV